MTAPDLIKFVETIAPTTLQQWQRDLLAALATMPAGYRLPDTTRRTRIYFTTARRSIPT